MPPKVHKEREDSQYGMYVSMCDLGATTEVATIMPCRVHVKITSVSAFDFPAQQLVAYIVGFSVQF